MNLYLLSPQLTPAKLSNVSEFDTRSLSRANRVSNC